MTAQNQRPFKVGDTVRHNQGTEWFLARDGYVVTKTGPGTSPGALGAFHRYSPCTLEEAFPVDGGYELVRTAEEYEQFAPGDLVRWIHANDDTVFALGIGGFLVTKTGKFVEYGEGGCRTLDQFTTEDFVQVFIP